MNKGVLFLIPTTISDNTTGDVLSDSVKDELKSIRHFFVENVRSARRFLSSLKIYESIEALHFQTLDKDTPEQALKSLFSPLFEGENVGILSEAGCPGVADPGSIAVNYAHRHEIRVRPLVGPSSILLALMGSGLNGQVFAFHGYLPIDKSSAVQAIKDLERESRLKRQTQIFIETPYRNNAMMENLKSVLHDNTLVCRAIDLTGRTEDIRTMTVKSWKGVTESLPKLPAIFLFLARS